MTRGLRVGRWGALVLCVVGLLWGPSAGCGKNAPPPAEDSKTKPDGDAPAKPTGDPLADLETRAFPLLIWAAVMVDREYFDRARFDPREQLVSAVTLLGLNVPEFFAEVDTSGESLKVTVRSKTAEFPLGELASLPAAANRLEEVLVFTQDVLDLEAEPLHELEYAAINGLFAPLDPHTILLTPEEHNDLGVRTRGRFGGIGAQIRAEDRRIVVVRVLPEMPADKAGVKGGDVILRIDGESTVNMTAPEAQELLRGPVGALVAIRVRRDDETLDFEIERNTIKIDSVQSAVLPGRVAYLQIATFQENTSEQVKAALAAAGDGGKGPSAVIVDLRGNSGGLLAQATAVVDLFVPRGELVIVRSAVGREVDAAQDETALDAKVPIVVMVDEESASAAEIVSGGLSALGRAVVVGRSSFGKGSVQMIKPAEPYGRELALKLTVAEYLVAGDKRIQSLGVMPHVELQPVEVSDVPGIARYYDTERFERRRERSRTANLPSAKHDPPIPPSHQPVSRLRYLWTAKLPDELAKQYTGRGPDAEPPEALLDPEVRIARQVGLALVEASSETPLAAIGPVVESVSAQEDARIATALAEYEVDWSAGPATKGDPAPSLSVRARVLDDMPLGAGKPFTLEVAVQNLGTSPLHRVHAITQCIHDELDGIELLVGRIEPGETQTRTMRLHVMPWHSDFHDRIALDVHVGEPDPQAPAGHGEVMFEIVGAPRPALAYDWWVVDDPALAKAAPARPPVELLPGEKPFAVAGNGDGVLQPGEKVLLAFAATNRGEGKSPDVKAILRNLSGEQGLLEEGAFDIGALDPGEQRTGAFGITVGDHADPAKPFEVELAIGDAHMRTRAQDKLPFRVLAEGPALTKGPSKLEVGEDGARLYNGAHASAPIVSDLAPGTVLETVGSIGSWRVLEAGPSRRFYVPEGPALAEAEAGAGRGSVLETSTLPSRPIVLPPSLALAEFPKKTTAAEVKLSGTAKHPGRVRDIVVLVRPPGTAQIERKVHYAANPWTMGDEGETLSFETMVPLAPGGNRVTILVRDGAKVEHRSDVWVYRESTEGAVPAHGG